MMSVRLLPVTILTAFLVPLAGCDNGTEPGDLGDFDPFEITRGLDRLVSPLQANASANANLGAALPDLEATGIELRTLATPLAHRVLRSVSLQPHMAPLLTTPLPAEFPSHVLGRTFTYDPEDGSWMVDETRDGAPDDGVRVIWYQLDGTGRIIVPLREAGHIDLTPQAGAATDSVVVTVVEARPAGDVTLVRVVQDRARTGDAVVTVSFAAAGHYTNGSDRVDFTASTESITDTASEDEDYGLRVTLEDPDTRYELRVDGATVGASGAYDDRITATVVRAGTTTVLDVRFVASGSGGEDVSGTLVQNGTLIANVSTAGNSYTFSAPDGGSFPVGQANDLNAVFRSMTLAGFEVLLGLPLFLPEGI